MVGTGSWGLVRRGVFLGWLSIALACLFAVGCAADTGEDVGADAAAADMLPAVQQASRQLRDARDRHDDGEARLSEGLSRLGGVLTEAEQQAYVQEFRRLPSIEADRTAYIEASMHLAVELERARTTRLDDIAEGIRGGFLWLSVYGKAQLYDDYRLLASTPDAAYALRFARRILRQERIYVEWANERVVDDIVAEALPHALLQACVQEDDAALAIRQVAREIAVTDELRSGMDALEQFVLDTDADAFLRRIEPLRDYSSSLYEAIVSSAAITGLWGKTPNLTAQQQVRIEQAVLILLQRGPSVLSAVGKATNLYRTVVLGADQIQWVANVSKILSRIGGAFVIVMNAIRIAHDIREFDGDSWDVLRIVASAIGILGGVAAFLPLGPAGLVLAAISIGISFLADWLENRARERTIDDEQRAVLGRLGFRQQLIDTILDTDRRIFKDLSETLQFSPERVRWLLDRTPSSFTGGRHTMPAGFYNYVWINKVLGWSADDLFAWFQSVVSVGPGNSGSPTGDETDLMLAVFFAAPEMDWSFSTLRTEAELEDWIAQRYEQVGGVPEYVQAFRNAHTFLLAH